MDGAMTPILGNFLGSATGWGRDGSPSRPGISYIVPFVPVAPVAVPPAELSV
jgi:hypothetical protein